MDKNLNNILNSPAERPDKRRAIKNNSMRTNDLEQKKRIPDTKLMRNISFKVPFLKYQNIINIG